ncbi:DUF7079 family protein [Trinickia diaoshuihuensis]|uniref:DUF7079 family protein n=1 Tax=Trinickia diaoshuihuensis TaxID=2292265 RepID=UPI0013C37268|nr:hypothetical protein [Trinickia diaoshuihuensis]
MAATEPMGVQRRAPVWEALSELFVGRELQEYDYAAIADTLRQSGYSIDELDRILREEVAPVFGKNLSPLAVPEMEGWARETVVEDVQAYLARQETGLLLVLKRIVPRKPLAKVASDRWERLCLRLKGLREQ